MAEESIMGRDFGVDRQKLIAESAKHLAIENQGEHDPGKCGCSYIGFDMWTCGHIDNE